LNEQPCNGGAVRPDDKKEWEESRNMIPEKTESGQEPEETMAGTENGMQMNM
jgi:hypothetical protein